MRKLALFVLLVPSIAYAAAGFADRYYDHKKWIFPAYAYCLVFGLIVLLGWCITSLIYKTKIRRISERISAYLKKSPLLAIAFTGILLAIPIGIIGAVSWEIIWFLSIFPFMGLMVAFPIILVNKRFRENLLLSSFWVKWSLLISISSITASILFIIMSDSSLLTGTDITYLAIPNRINQEFYYPTHPYDSMKEIWSMPLFFIAEIAIAITLYSFGILNRVVSRKLSALRHRKRIEMNDIYTEE